MSDERKTTEKTPLPVTAEVGGEGGSYADATMQGGTNAGTEGLPRADAGRDTAPIDSSVAMPAEEGVDPGPSPGEGMRRFPTERAE